MGACFAEGMGEVPFWGVVELEHQFVELLFCFVEIAGGFVSEDKITGDDVLSRLFSGSLESWIPSSTAFWTGLAGATPRRGRRRGRFFGRSDFPVSRFLTKHRGNHEKRKPQDKKAFNYFRKQHLAYVLLNF